MRSDIWLMIVWRHQQSVHAGSKLTQSPPYPRLQHYAVSATAKQRQQRVVPREQLSTAAPAMLSHTDQFSTQLGTTLLQQGWQHAHATMTPPSTLYTRP
jgi:hypothetical protein